ncbi:FAD-dependent monooxygenase [Gordonia sp. HY002]|uniref:FAD-dependent monooxygenase n=1 Tax=Gordonia zhenghanii TaxID=2911516 RepID=UPI001EEFE09C|nr:FAD-dependent monooxygenase [Gordonia zhenghanii]MCF8570418.1 FAD-dependent monooxygenase [Gordonia zhenghanii]MCF8604648.1 FAD-dependent monooxygenase [Gordonia zhenghanii]
MRLASIAVLGGGPGGLYAARLLKISNPDARVTVYEQGDPDKTFGFGVGLASRTQRNLRLADEDSLEAIVAESHPHEMSMKVGDSHVRLAHGELLAIGRATLLSVLQRFAKDAGVELKFGKRVTFEDVNADLIVAADGINSATRTEMAHEFGPHVTQGEGLYLWCGTDFALESAVFTPATTEHGTFVAHAYPYTDDGSTFLIETDEQTWRRAGFDVSTKETPFGESDQTSLDYLREAFADPLQGHRLIGNRTKWTQFRTVRCDSWHTRNIVLLGDAAHTAHYSIGSGTKLAMEDAIVLDRALAENDDLDSAFAAYEEARMPAVAHLQAIAERSMAWWDMFPERMNLPVEQLMIAYMTRAGKVSLERFAESAGEVVKAGAAAYAGCALDEVPPPANLNEWALGRPSAGRSGRIADTSLRDADGTTTLEITDRPWSADVSRLLADLPASSTFWLTGADDRESTLDRLDVAERIRIRSGAVVVVDVPEQFRSDGVAGAVSERVDLISFTS